MKKTTLLLAAAWMLLLWFVPQSAWADPEPKTVSIYQSGFKRGTKLLYPLTPTTVGGITYTPVDMGAGVAWADRNVGAENPEDAGTNFYWGDISGEESFSSAVGDNKYYTQARNMTSQTSILPLEYDAAYKTLGANWRMPTKQEMGTLWNFDFYPPGDSNIGGVNKNYFIQQSYDENKGITCTYQFEPEKTILIPFSNEYSPENQSSSKNIRFWTSLVGNLPNNSYSSPQNIPAVVYSGTSDGGGWNSTKISHGLPVRPVYVPTCETCTLKIGIQASGRYCILYGNDGTCWEDEAGTITYWFDYICEKGQQVTVNPVGNTGYVFNRWLASNNSTPVSVPGNVFTVTENATYYATFQEQGYDITWENYDHSVLDVVYTREGDIPEYTGATPTRPAPDGVDWVYIWTGWTPTPVASTTEATYTATYAQGYTITANTGGSGTVTLTATGYSDKINTGSYVSGTSVTMTANAGTGTTFVRWTDTGSTNPTRVVTVNANAEYTAEFTIESADKLVNIYQSTTADTTKILYLLKSTTVGGITYRPVDMGYGVAWANKNIGASDSTMVGTYFYWGDIEGHSSFSSSRHIDITSFSSGKELASGQDAAYQLIGTSWSIPSFDEFRALIGNTKKADNKKFTSYSNNDNHIIIPAGGVNKKNSISNGDYQYYWTKTFASKTGSGSGVSYNFIRRGDNYYTVLPYLIDSTSLSYYYYGMPIRAIYKPYDTYKLTVKVGSNKYVYVCQPGQNVTVTAVPSTSYLFKWWGDNHSNTTATRTFAMTSDIEVEAVFQIDPNVPAHTATFVNWNGTPLYQVTVPKGATPIYDGATPTKAYWDFEGWTPAISAMGDDDVTYTATFSFESAAASVDVYQNVSANTTKILYYLPEEKEFNDGNKYSAIDMGYGVAWSDRNVGATSVNAIGSYFRWGDPIASNYNLKKDAQNWSSLSGGQNFAEEYDMAKGVLGSNWHVPSNTEYQRLLDNTTISNNNTFTSTSNNNSIIFLAGGCYSGDTYWGGEYQYYWSSTYAGSDYYGRGVSYCLERNKNNNAYEVTYVDYDDNSYIGTRYGMLVRAIYEPSYTTYTLTINVGSYSYQYICQAGQSITVTANATTEGYVFDKWLLEDGSTPDNVDGTLATRTFVMTENITRTATFHEAPVVTTYNVTGTPNNNNYGSVSGSGSVNHGGNITLTASPEEHYHFVNWTENKTVLGTNATLTLENVTADHTSIIANFAINTYTVKWKNGEDVIETDTDVPYGETPSYDGETPTKDEDAENTYTFDAWSPAITTVAGNATYTATFTATPKPVEPAELHIVLEEAEDDDYYDNFANHQGKTANTVTLNRQFEQGRWSTLCLPFEVSGGMMTTLKMSGRVYEFKYATGNANVGEGVNLYFSNAKKMEAGKGYIVNADAKLAEKTSFVFSNVKIDVTADSVKPLNSATAYNKLSGYKSEGTIELVGTLRNGTLKGTESGNTYMGLKSNKIYYPNISQGSTIWAYRGIFRSSKALDIKNMQKMRIIVDGEDRGEIIIDADGDVRAPSDAASRKFIRDGVLYIEREGVVYDAQGKRVEGAF